jgi:hypothetical protein
VVRLPGRRGETPARPRQAPRRTRDCGDVGTGRSAWTRRPCHYSGKVPPFSWGLPDATPWVASRGTRWSLPLGALWSSKLPLLRSPRGPGACPRHSDGRYRRSTLGRARADHAQPGRPRRDLHQGHGAGHQGPAGALVTPAVPSVHRVQQRDGRDLARATPDACPHPPERCPRRRPARGGGNRSEAVEGPHRRRPRHLRADPVRGGAHRLPGAPPSKARPGTATVVGRQAHTAEPGVLPPPDRRTTGRGQSRLGRRAAPVDGQATPGQRCTGGAG